jgi:hypothetical protein
MQPTQSLTEHVIAIREFFIKRFSKGPTSTDSAGCPPDLEHLLREAELAWIFASVSIFFDRDRTEADLYQSTYFAPKAVFQ